MKKITCVFVLALLLFTSLPVSGNVGHSSQQLSSTTETYEEYPNPLFSNSLVRIHSWSVNDFPGDEWSMKSSKTDREENLISKGVSACSECIFNRKKLIVKTSKNSVYSAHLLLNRSPMKCCYINSYDFTYSIIFLHMFG